jgi:hypothetical protein
MCWYVKIEGDSRLHPIKASSAADDIAAVYAVLRDGIVAECNGENKVLRVTRLEYRSDRILSQPADIKLRKHIAAAANASGVPIQFVQFLTWSDREFAPATAPPH